jgi:hypothetical protein
MGLGFSGHGEDFGIFFECVFETRPRGYKQNTPPAMGRPLTPPGRPWQLESPALEPGSSL